MRTSLAALTALSVVLPGAAFAQPLTATDFTYQGQLKQAGVPVTGQADIVFRLFDAATEGTQVGSTVGASFVEVENGLFAVPLDFGAEAFDGNARWLEIEVEFPSGEGNWTTLKPRQPLTATPYALQSRGLYCDNTGEVGIGTTNPQSRLHVVSDGSRVLRVRNASTTGGTAIVAEATAGSGYTFALDGYTSSPDGSTIYAFNEAESGTAYAISGETTSPNGIAIYGHATNGSERSTGIGVYGRSDSDDSGTGVYGEATSAYGNTYGVRGVSSAGSGVRGEHKPTGNYGNLGTSTAGVYGRTAQSAHYGVRGHTSSAAGYAGYFTGGRNYFEGNVGIGAADPASKLHVAGGDLRVDGDMELYQGGVLAVTSQALSQGKNLNFLNTLTAGYVTQVGTSTTDGAGYVILRSQNGGTTTVELDADADDSAGDPTAGLLKLRSTGGGPGGQLAIQNDNGSTRIQALGGGTGDGGTLEMFNAAGGGTIFLDADDTNDGTIRLSDAAGNTGVLLRADHASSVAGEISLYNDAGIETVELIAAEGVSNGGQIRLRTAAGTETIQLDAEYGEGGGAYLELNGGATDPTMYLDGGGQTKTDATLRVNNHQPTQGMAAYFTNSSTFATMHIQNNGPGETLWLENGGGGDILVARSTRRWEFWVDGDGVTNSRVLRIHGGADLAEGFDVRGLPGDDVTPSHADIQDMKTQTPEWADLVPAPGMVVSIDPDNPGKLAVSAESYDRKVAGIISGAGGVKPGMLMGQGDSQADGDYPVALTGRVYCLCDASKASIKPGDLLTTSELPGHAMKVADYQRAQGAIIGKAMTSLSDAQGLVLVLVSLQ